MTSNLTTVLSRRRVVFHTFLVTSGGLLINILAYLKSAILASYFGTGSDNNAYLFSLVLPNMFACILIGSVSQTLVPVFSQLLTREGREEAWRFGRTMVIGTGIVLAVIYIGLCLTFGPFVAPTADGFTPEMRSLSTELLYLGGSFMVFAGMASAIRALVQCMESFVVFTLGQVIGWVVGIAAVVVLKPLYGIHGAAIAMSVASLAEILAYVPFLKRSGFFSNWGLQISAKFLPALNILFIYVMSSIAIEGNTAFTRWLASTLQGEAISYINYASNLHQIASSLLGSGICVALLPLMSRQASSSVEDVFVSTLTWNVRLFVLLFFPYAVALWKLAPFLVSILYERGAFDAQSTAGVAHVWRIWGLVAFAYAFGAPIRNALYARKQARAVLLATVGSVVLNVVLSLLFVRNYGYLGLAMATSIGMSAMYLSVVFMFQRKQAALAWRGKIIPTAVRSLLACVPIYLLCEAAHPILSGSASFLGKALHIAEVCVAGAVIFVVTLLLLREAVIWDLIAHARRRMTSNR